MTRDEMHDDEEFEAFAKAIGEAMLILRYIAGKHPVCAACFCAAVAEQVEKIGDGIEHGTHLPPLDVEEIKQGRELFGGMSPVMGSA